MFQENIQPELCQDVDWKGIFRGCALIRIEEKCACVSLRSTSCRRRSRPWRRSCSPLPPPLWLSSHLQEAEALRLLSRRATAETRAPHLPCWGRSPTQRQRSQSSGSAGRWGRGSDLNIYQISLHVDDNLYCRWRWTVSCSASSKRGGRRRRWTGAAASWREFTGRTSTPASPSRARCFA